jgi:hypothetical protein
VKIEEQLAEVAREMEVLETRLHEAQSLNNFEKKHRKRLANSFS